MATRKRRRRCTGTTKRGTRCKAAPLKGTQRCAAHPLSPDSTRFGSPEQAAAAGQLGGRPARPRPSEVARKLIEDNIAALLRPHFRVLGFDVVIDEQGPRLVAVEGGGAKHHTTFWGELMVSEHDDLGAMMTAAEKLLDRVYGKPKQATELTGADGGPVRLEGTDLGRLSTEKLEQLEQLLTEAAADGPAEPR